MKVLPFFVFLGGCGTFIALGDDYSRRCDVLTTRYADVDLDGYGDPANEIISCGIETDLGYVDNHSDCDDKDPTKNPLALDDECDGVDQNCDGIVDNGILQPDCIRNDPNGFCLGTTRCKDAMTECVPRLFLDNDKDGHGAAEVFLPDGMEPKECPLSGGEYAGEPDDCDDHDKDVFPQEDAEDNSVWAEICDVMGAASDRDCDGLPGRLFLNESFSGISISPVDTSAAWWSPVNSQWTIRDVSSVCGGPALDMTPNDNDNKLLAVGSGDVCLASGLGGQVFSPTIDTTNAKSLFLIFSYWLNSADINKSPGVLNVGARQGAVLTFLRSYSKAKAGWTRDFIDISAYRGSTTTIVFSYDIGEDAASGPSIDDVRLTDDLCEIPQ